jgi:hypothetical protein
MEQARPVGPSVAIQDNHNGQNPLPVEAIGVPVKDDRLERFGVHTHMELRNRVTQVSNTHFLIDGILTQPSLTLVVGDSGIGKSPLIYQAMIAIAAGLPFLGRTVRKGRTLYMDCENGIHQVDEIVSQLSKHLKLTACPDDLLLWNLNDCPTDWGQRGHELRDVIREARPDVVVIDPLNAIFNGIEQDNTRAGTAYQELRGLMREFGCSFVCLHHPRKFDPRQVTEDQSLELGNLHRWFDNARGHRVLINGSDLRLGVEPATTSLNDSQLVVRGFRRVYGEIPMMRLYRVLDDDGEPIGYNQMSGAQLLSENPEQQATFKRLPSEFAFKQAMQTYGKQNQATRDFLVKCIGAGLLRQVRKGVYEKVAAGGDRGEVAEQQVPNGAIAGLTGLENGNRVNLTYIQ